MDEKILLPVITLCTRPLCVPPELLTFLPTAQIRVISDDGEGIAEVGEALKMVEAIMARQAQGFFTINEAAQVLADATGSPVKTQLNKLLRDIEKKKFEALDQDDGKEVDDGQRCNYASVLRVSDMVRAGFAFPDPPKTVPVVADGPALLTKAPAWSLKRPKRFQGYGKPLYDLLRSVHAVGQPKPSARDVLDTWKNKPPTDVVEVTDNGLKYYDARGNTKPADLEAIRKAIGRMTK